MRRRWGVVLLVGCVLALVPLGARADDAGVAIRDNVYLPGTISIGLGESVTWTNEGSNAHTVTSEGFFDSSPDCIPSPVPINCLSPGSQYTLTFDTAGTYRYSCKIHGDAMSGLVVVGTPTTSTSSTTSTSTTSTSTTSTLPASSAPPGQASQQTPPSLPNGTRTAGSNPARVRDSGKDDDNDLRALVLVDVFIAGATTFAGVALVRKGRVPFG
jgi:plastocyanin